MPLVLNLTMFEYFLTVLSLKRERFVCVILIVLGDNLPVPLTKLTISIPGLTASKCFTTILFARTGLDVNCEFAAGVR